MFKTFNRCAPFKSFKTLGWDGLEPMGSQLRDGAIADRGRLDVPPCRRENSYKSQRRRRDGGDCNRCDRSIHRLIDDAKFFWNSGRPEKNNRKTNPSTLSRISAPLSGKTQAKPLRPTIIPATGLSVEFGGRQTTKVQDPNKNPRRKPMQFMMLMIPNVYRDNKKLDPGFVPDPKKIDEMSALMRVGQGRQNPLAERPSSTQLGARVSFSKGKPDE